MFLDISKYRSLALNEKKAMVETNKIRVVFLY
jgi:hypothetical protein